MNCASLFYLHELRESFLQLQMDIDGAVEASGAARTHSVLGNGFQSDFLDPLVLGHAEEVKTRRIHARLGPKTKERNKIFKMCRNILDFFVLYRIALHCHTTNFTGLVIFR